MYRNIRHAQHRRASRLAWRYVSLCGLCLKGRLSTEGAQACLRAAEQASLFRVFVTQYDIGIPISRKIYLQGRGHAPPAARKRAEATVFASAAFSARSAQRHIPPREPEHPPCSGGKVKTRNQKTRPRAKGAEPGSRGTAPCLVVDTYGENEVEIGIALEGRNNAG